MPTSRRTTQATQTGDPYRRSGRVSADHGDPPRNSPSGPSPRLPVRELIDGIAGAVRAGDDATIRALLIRLAPIADTTALLLLRYRLGLSESPREAAPAARPEPHQSCQCERPGAIGG